MKEYHPDRIIIEPSGVGKLSDVIQAVVNVHDNELQLNSFVAVIDAKKCKTYSLNFGEFFNNQIEYASTIILSRTQNMDINKLKKTIEMIKKLNDKANIITTPWDELTGDTIMNALENKDSLQEILLKEVDACPVCGHHHDHEEHHHHHEHNHECGCGHDHHHHEGHHHHEHQHHHADEVFTSMGKETIHTYSQEQLETILKELSSSPEFGQILRAKGILQTPEKTWLHFDLVPGEYEIRVGPADYTGRICVIGKDLLEDKIVKLFGVEQ